MPEAAGVVVQLINGSFYASILFLTAVGLNVIFGILGILNLAHGSFYMLGAYIAYTIMVLALGVSWGSLLAASIAAFVTLALIGVAVERGLIKPLYNRPEEHQLLLTFGLILVFDDLVKMIWGPEYKSFPRVPGGQVVIGTHRVPVFDFVVIVVAFAVAWALERFFKGTITGKRMRAVGYDKEVASALGIDAVKYMALAFALGSGLAGLAGAVAGPLYTAQPGMGLDIIIYSFAVIVIGGAGSIIGSLVGAYIVGLSRSIMYIIYPRLDIALIYIIMILVLLVKPEGLFARVEVERR